MGCYSPPPEVDEALVERVMDEAVAPIVATLRGRGIDYRGVLYAGIMVTNGGPVVLEYNVRFGDPEAQVVLPRLDDDPVDLLMAVAEGRLTGRPRFSADPAVCVVAAAGGYPESPVTGDVIAGLGPDGQLAEPVEGVTVLHAGTSRDQAGFRVAGGRVLGLTAVAPSLATARERAYEAASRISWPGMHFRRDIALSTEPAAALR
jgi:phosphoribosylamine--glycine ligase